MESRSRIWRCYRLLAVSILSFCLFFLLEIGQNLEKVLAGAKGSTAEENMRLLRLGDNISGSTACVEAMYSVGSPQHIKMIHDAKKKGVGSFCEK